MVVANIANPANPAGANTQQFYWDQPGVSPMAGALSAAAMMAPYPSSVGVVGWWAWWALPPATSVLLRLYRYRRDPGFTYTQISDPYTIVPATPTSTIVNLTSLLRANAIDFTESKNDVLALSVQVTGAFNMRALTQRIQFGAP